MINLKVTNDPCLNFPKLTWRNSSTEEFTYRVFRRKISSSINTNDVSEDFMPICTSDTNNIEESISILNIHYDSKETVEFIDFVGETIKIKESEVLLKWINESTIDAPQGYGMNKIHITSMPISEFNNNPGSKINSEDNRPMYDVICIGFYNKSNNQQLSEESLDTIKEFIDKGYGVVIGNGILSSDNKDEEYAKCLRDKLGLSFRKLDKSLVKIPKGYNETDIVKAGQLIRYPWNVGTLGDKIDVPPTNMDIQLKDGIKWIETHSTNDDGVKENISCYLSTYKNVAIIQIGNELNISDKERKLLVNSIFHTKQVTSNKAHDDYMGIDDERPLPPTIIGYYMDDTLFTTTFDFRSEDIGVKIQYYIEGTSKVTGEIVLSNIVENIFVSDIDYFMYKIEPINAEMASVNPWVKTKDMSIISNPLNKGYYSFKIMAIDKNANVSDITEEIFFMKGLPVKEKSPAITKYPNAQRVNHRYRGPHESRKANDVIRQMTYNLNNLKNIINELDVAKTTMLERPSINYESIYESTRVAIEFEKILNKKQ